jgi:hypothetical protein
MFHLIGSRIILRNGGLLEGQVNDKKFHRDVLKFTTKTVTPTKLHNWYRDFHRHCLACGIYTIPYELIINGYGGSKGFTYGTDLPADFEATQNQCSELIRSSFRKPDSFPDSTEEHNIAHPYSNGYDGLFAIITRDHPTNFVDYPEDLTRNLPYQENYQTIHEYHKEFMNVCHLRSNFPGHTTILSESTLVTHFIAPRTRWGHLGAKLPHLGPSQVCYLLFSPFWDGCTHLKTQVCGYIYM